MEKLKDFEKFKDDETNDNGNSESQKDPECGKITLKWAAELIAIGCYLTSIIVLIISYIYSNKYGNINTVLIEFAIAFPIEQVKALLIQPIIWWIFIRYF